MSSNIDHFEEQLDLEHGIKMTDKRVLEISSNKIDESDNFMADVNEELKEVLFKKISIEIDLFQRTTVFSNEPSMWI
jgi:hypothetical protein